MTEQASELRCAIELRSDDTRSGPGRLTGTLIVEGEQASDRRELFMPGALTWPTEGIVLRRQHARDKPITMIQPRREGNTIVVDEPLPDTTAGRDAAAEIRAGMFKGLSVEFVSQRERFQGGLRRIGGALLKGAGLVDTPSYTSAVVSVRNKGAGRRVPWL